MCPPPPVRGTAGPSRRKAGGCGKAARGGAALVSGAEPPGDPVSPPAKQLPTHSPGVDAGLQLLLPNVHVHVGRNVEPEPAQNFDHHLEAGL